MTILHTEHLVEDLRAVIAAITPNQLKVLLSLREVIEERIKELKENDKAEISPSKES